MRKIMMMTLMAVGLVGGVAAADPYHHDNTTVVVRHDGDVHYRSYRERPAVRYERHDDRRGYRWNAGAWRWQHSEWIWSPGVYVRIR